MRPPSTLATHTSNTCINAPAFIPDRSEIAGRRGADPLDLAEGAREMLPQVLLRQVRPAGDDCLGHRGMVGDDLLRLARARQVQPSEPVQVAAAAADELAQAGHA